MAAANAVVANNARRKPKRLFTDAGDGERIQVFQAADERDEGRWIGSEIEKLHDGGTSYDDMAVFYRTNAQSRILEDMFLRAGVPYKIVGGTRFFDRAEVRDVMAYLKLVVNPDDDVAALRVVNTPRRGIGTTSIGKIRELAADEGISFFSACQMAIAETGLLGAKVRSALAEFTGVIEASRHFTGELSGRRGGHRGPRGPRARPRGRAQRGGGRPHREHQGVHGRGRRVRRDARRGGDAREPGAASRGWRPRTVRRRPLVPDGLRARFARSPRRVALWGRGGVACSA